MAKAGPPLSDVSVQLSSELHPTLNQGLLATSISSTSSREVWWLGSCGHEWLQRVNLRVSRGYGCTICSGKEVLAGFNDLASRFPVIASQWSLELNDFPPTQVSSGSGKSFFWMCQSGHSYRSPVSERIRQLKKGRLTSCPFCSNRRIDVGKNDLAAQWPALIAEWDFDKNDVDPTTIPPGSRMHVWWKCEKGHPYDMTPFARTTNGQNCPVCAGKRVIEGVNDLATSYPEIADSWDYERNSGSKSPGSVTAKSGSKYWWLCSLSHSYQATVAHRTEGRGCPYCAGKKLLTGFNDLATKRPEFVSLWSPQNEVPPSNVLNGTAQIYAWKCGLGHDWFAAPVWVKGCPICANQVLLPGFNDLASVNPVLAEEWHPTRNKPLEADGVLAGSGKHYWWLCANGHSWRTSPNNRLSTGCPRCSLGGYDQSKPGILYFLRHPELRARKVGITNTDSKRLQRLEREGWVVLGLWTHENGLIPLNTETLVLRWLRQDLMLPPYLSKELMRSTGGWSETFSDSEPSDSVVHEFIELQIRKFDNKHGAQEAVDN
jgi:hypothetical protein